MININKDSRVHKQKKEKICKYPNCGKTFLGIGPAKYCEEHKQPKFRAIINKLLQEKKKKFQ